MVAPNEKAVVWVVDDVPSNRKLLDRLVQDAGFSSRTFASAEDALTAMDSERPDLVLLDVMMPGISGLDALNAIRTTGSGTPVPVILVTSMDDALLRRRALLAGARDFIVKPIHRSELVARVQRALDERATGPSLAGGVAPRSACSLVAGLGILAVVAERTPPDVSCPECSLSHVQWRSIPDALDVASGSWGCAVIAVPDRDAENTVRALRAAARDVPIAVWLDEPDPGTEIACLESGARAVIDSANAALSKARWRSFLASVAGSRGG